MTAVSEPSASPPTSETLLQAGRSLGREFASRASDGDALRTMPVDLVTRARDAGLFALTRPRTLGGSELDLPGQLVIYEELAHGDGSFAWSVITGASGFTLSWYSPDVAREVVADDPLLPVAQMIGPLGTATADGAGGYVIEGRWPFSSGCRHAGCFLLGVRISGAPAPNWHIAVLDPNDVLVLDTWDTLGLRGTGSHDVVVAGARVSAARLARPFFEAPQQDGPLWRVPFVTQLAVGHAGLALGVGRRALEEFVDLAATTRRGGGAAVAENGDAQVALARADGGLRAARAFVTEALGELWDTAAGGDPPSTDQRAALLLAALTAQRAAEAAVDALLPLAGARAIYASHPLQRCFRDLHTAGQHISVSADAWKACAGHRLEREPLSFRI